VTPNRTGVPRGKRIAGWAMIYVVLLLGSGCPRELDLLADAVDIPDAGRPGDDDDDNDLDAGTDGGVDGGSDAGVDGGMDAGIDAGPPTSCDDPDLPDATLCLDDAEARPGNTVGVVVTLGLPPDCGAGGSMNGTLEVDATVLSLANPVDQPCLQRTQDGGLVIWTRETVDDGGDCAISYPAGPQDLLQIRIAEEATPGTYPLR